MSAAVPLNSVWGGEVKEKILRFKKMPFGSVKVAGNSRGSGFEILLLTAGAGSDEMIDLLGRWRKENEAFYLSQFPVSRERTAKWYKNHLIDLPDRLLFIIRSGGTYVGHVGLFRFNYESRACEIDNILRGERSHPGMIGDAILTMMKWGRDELGISGYALKVLGDNQRAIRLYLKLGYVETARVPLLLAQGKDGPEWQETPAGWTGEAARHYSVMTFKGELK